jgi:hypothetical protein
MLLKWSKHASSSRKSYRSEIPSGFYKLHNIPIELVPVVSLDATFRREDEIEIDGKDHLEDGAFDELPNRTARLMALTLRPTGMSSPASREQVDFIIHDDDGEAVGRIYKNGGIDTPPDVQWSWSITAYVDSLLGITTSAKVATLGRMERPRDRRDVEVLHDDHYRTERYGPKFMTACRRCSSRTNSPRGLRTRLAWRF